MMPSHVSVSPRTPEPLASSLSPPASLHCSSSSLSLSLSLPLSFSLSLTSSRFSSLSLSLFLPPSLALSVRPRASVSRYVCQSARVFSSVSVWFLVHLSVCQCVRISGCLSLVADDHPCVHALAYTVAYWHCAPCLLTLWARAGRVYADMYVSRERLGLCVSGYPHPDAHTLARWHPRHTRTYLHTHGQLWPTGSVGAGHRVSRR